MDNLNSYPTSMENEPRKEEDSSGFSIFALELSEPCVTLTHWSGEDYIYPTIW